MRACSGSGSRTMPRPADSPTGGPGNPPGEAMRHADSRTAVRRGPAFCAGLLLFLSGACAAGGDSGPESSPSAPTLLQAEPGDQCVTLRWNPVAGAASYTLYWSQAASVNTHSGTPISGVQSPYLHDGLTNGSTYAYVVVAENAL